MQPHKIEKTICEKELCSVDADTIVDNSIYNRSIEFERVGRERRIGCQISQRALSDAKLVKHKACGAPSLWLRSQSRKIKECDTIRWSCCFSIQNVKTHTPVAMGTNASEHKQTTTKSIPSYLVRELHLLVLKGR